MKFSQAAARAFVPAGSSFETALASVSHLAIGAHADDLEIMAWSGLEAGGRFGGVVCTDGAGSSRTGKYAQFAASEMATLRAAEQETAAQCAGFAALVQLAHPSRALENLTADFAQIFAHARPQILYTHNPADKHPTHLAVFCAVLKALRELPLASRPAKLFGCEVWRGLDWLGEADKVRLPIRDLAAMQDVIAIFDSQISGGKRYDLAAPGRARANSVFDDANAADANAGQWFALDCTPLLLDDDLDPVEFLAAFLDRFRTEALAQLRAAFDR